MSYDVEELQRLLILSQKGNQEAYREFLTQILPLVSSIAQRRVFHQDDVSDVIQEMLLSIHRALPSYDSSRPVLPWLVTISERRVVDYIRKITGKKNVETLFRDGDVTSFKTEANSTIEVDALDFLETLPEMTKKAITLTKIDGYSTKEAAEILQIRENALRTKISRGLSKLKEKAKKGLLDE